MRNLLGKYVITPTVITCQKNIKRNYLDKKLHRIRVFSGLDGHYSNTSSFPSPLLYYNRLSPSSPDTVFMITDTDGIFIALCLEWFFYGKICALTSSCTLAEEVRSIMMAIIPRSRTLFRNIRHVFATTTEPVHWQDGNHPSLRSLSSLRSIYRYRCH